MRINPYVYIFTMAFVLMCVRALPMTLIRKQIKSRFIRSFLYYVPYVTLAVMTVPAIVDATQSPISGVLALVVGIVAAFFNAGLFKVAIGCCLTVLVSELVLFPPEFLSRLLGL
ncbi:MAG: AzlD domain-containing protein [Oscillospiraceae bacterium]|nr:AzlD domain-containing protein [Oscillospiraceae bacterium]